MKKLALAVLISSMPTLAHAIQVAGTGTGPIPDGTSGTCADWPASPAGPPPTGAGPALTISYNVAGFADPTVTSVGVRLTGTHTWVGDITAILVDPSGTRRQFVMADAGTGATGSSSDFAGPYNFEDIFTGDYSAAAAATPVPSGNYRAFRAGGVGHTPVTLNTTFGGMTTAEANGTWQLIVHDLCAADTGSISATTLFINEPSPVQLQSFSID